MGRTRNCRFAHHVPNLGDEGQWWCCGPGRFTTVTDFATLWIGRWVGSRADLDALEGDEFLAPV
jgi:hypothetical protein